MERVFMGRELMGHGPQSFTDSRRSSTRMRRPGACSDETLREFERLVREAFEGSDEGLLGRIRSAHGLAFRYGSQGELVAIAGLKRPDERYRIDVFGRARAGADPAGYRLELGWVYVVPEHRGRRLGEHLCRQLLDEVPGDGIFATTRPDNAPMIDILRTLGFAPAGTPFRHLRRDEELGLFLRRQPAYEGPASLV